MKPKAIVGAILIALSLLGIIPDLYFKLVCLEAPGKVVDLKTQVYRTRRGEGTSYKPTVEYKRTDGALRKFETEWTGMRYFRGEDLTVVYNPYSEAERINDFASGTMMPYILLFAGILLIILGLDWGDPEEHFMG